MFGLTLFSLFGIYVHLHFHERPDLASEAHSATTPTLPEGGLVADKQEFLIDNEYKFSALRGDPIAMLKHSRNVWSAAQRYQKNDLHAIVLMKEAIELLEDAYYDKGYLPAGYQLANCFREDRPHDVLRNRGRFYKILEDLDAKGYSDIEIAEKGFSLVKDMLRQEYLPGVLRGDPSSMGQYGLELWRRGVSCELNSPEAETWQREGVAWMEKGYRDGSLTAGNHLAHCLIYNREPGNVMLDFDRARKLGNELKAMRYYGINTFLGDLEDSICRSKRKSCCP